MRERNRIPFCCRDDCDYKCSRKFTFLIIIAAINQSAQADAVAETLLRIIFFSRLLLINEVIAAAISNLLLPSLKRRGRGKNATEATRAHAHKDWFESDYRRRWTTLRPFHSLSNNNSSSNRRRRATHCYAVALVEMFIVFNVVVQKRKKATNERFYFMCVFMLNIKCWVFRYWIESI